MKHPFIITSEGKALGKKPNRQNIVSQYINTTAGRSALANAIIQPLRTRLGYSDLARKAISIQPLPQGALPIYDSDVAEALTLATKDSVIGTLGPTPAFKHNRLTVNSNGKAGKKRVLRGSLDVAIQNAKQQIMEQEDEEIFKVLYSLTKSGNKEE